GGAGGGRSVEVGCEGDLGLVLPVVRLVEGREFRLGGLAQPRRGPLCPGPGDTARERAPPGGRKLAAGGRVVDPDASGRSALAVGVGEQVSLDRGCDDGAVPFEQGGDGEAGRFATAGRTDDRQAGTRFGGQESVADMAEGEPPRDGSRNLQAA